MSGGAAANGLDVCIGKTLGGFTLDVAFKGASDGVTAVFGPSGAGKSQLLAAVAGASRPDRGWVRLGGRTLFDSDTRIDVAMERRAIGWVVQDGRLFPHLSVEANLRYGERRARGRDAGVRFDEIVQTLGIATLLARHPASLSGGERQRVAIGRALLSQPALLLMDEPLAALDLPRRAEILPYLEQLKARVRLPMLYVTHALSEVVRLADRLVVLEAGRVLAQGPVAEVLAREDLALRPARAHAVALDGVVAGHDAARGVTRLRIGEAFLLVPILARPVGAPVHATVLARDVLLAGEAPQGLSVRNILPGTLEAVAAPQASGMVLVRVRLQGGPVLMSAVTTDALQALSLTPGASVFAVITSVAVEGVPPGGPLQAFKA